VAFKTTRDAGGDLVVVIIDKRNNTWTSTAQGNAEESWHSRDCEGFTQAGHE
jgi:hypothetical protein